MEQDAFSHVLAGGFSVPGTTACDLLFIDTTGGDGFSCAVRVGALAGLLSGGADWEEAAGATGFRLQARATDPPGRQLLVELSGFGLLPLDIFAVAADPLQAVVRMVRSAGGQL